MGDKNLPAVSKKQNKLRNKIYFCMHHESHGWKEQDPDRVQILWYTGQDCVAKVLKMMQKLRLSVLRVRIATVALSRSSCKYCVNKNLSPK